MDNPNQDYEFLDLSDLGEAELNLLRLVLDSDPQQQGLSLPWSDEDGASVDLVPDDVNPDCRGSTPVEDGSCDWVASPDPSTHIQYGEPINGGHLDLVSDIEVTSGDESSETVLQDVGPGSTASTMLHPQSMGGVVVTSSSDSSLIHGPPSQGYPPSQPTDDQHTVYSNVPYVAHNVMYQHAIPSYPHPPPVTTFQMIDTQQQPPPSRDQSRGRGRKPMNKSRDMMHSQHNPDMMARSHMPHGFENYQPYFTQYPPYTYQQIQPVHQAAGSPIYVPYMPYEYHSAMGVPHQGVPPKVPSQHSFSQAPPVSVPVPTPPVPAPPSVPAAPLVPPPIIPVHIPNPMPDVVPASAVIAVPPIHALATPAPVPAPLLTQTFPPAPAPTSVPAPAPAPPPTSVPAPGIAPVVALTPAPSAPSAPLPTAAPATPSPAKDTKPPIIAGAQASEQSRVPISRVGGPPAGAVLSGRRPVDLKKPILTPKVEAAIAPTQTEEKLNPSVNEPPGITASVQPHVSPEAPPRELSPKPEPASAAVVTQSDELPPSEPSAAVCSQAPPVSGNVPLVKAESAAPTQSSGSPWNNKRASFASLFSSKDNSSGQSPGPYSPSSTSNAVPSSYGLNNQRGDGPQAVSPPSQSGWGPMQPPHKSSNLAQLHSRSAPIPGAVPSGIAPGLPPPNPAHEPKLYRLSEFLHQYKLDHKPASLQPRGLTNRNNWCYINATLQALLACPPFYNLFINMPDTPSNRSASESRTPIMDSMRQFVKEFVQLPASARLKRADRNARTKEGEGVAVDIPTGSAFEPVCVYRMLSVIRTDTMVEGRQEDAEEFLSCLLNGLNDEMLEVMKVTGDLTNGDISTVSSPPPLPSNGETESFIQEEDDEWKVMGPKNKGSITRRADFGRTPLSDIFRGQLRSRVFRKTHENHEKTDNVQPFFTLQLDIEKCSSVKKALEQYVEKYQLEGVTCSRSNQEVLAWQEVQLEELPPVLLLHLKCFDYSQDGCSKILKSIQYEIDLKVDSKLLSSKKTKSSNHQQYKLFAVVYHDGKEATKGHYITDAFHVGYNSWIRYDDSTVQHVTPHQVLGPRTPRVPYLLYYRRLDTIDRH